MKARREKSPRRRAFLPITYPAASAPTINNAMTDSKTKKGGGQLRHVIVSIEKYLHRRYFSRLHYAGYAPSEDASTRPGSRTGLWYNPAHARDVSPRFPEPSPRGG